MRLLNFCVLALLVAAAAYVYEIKFESTLRAERVAKMRGDIRRERDAIAALRAEWATLENPARIQGLAQRHLPLRPADAAQYDPLDNLPERPPPIVQRRPTMRSATAIEDLDPAAATGSLPSPDAGNDGSRWTPLPLSVPQSSAAPRREPWRRRVLLGTLLYGQQRRPHRQGARPRRARDVRLRRGLCGHRRAPCDVRGGAGKPFRAARRRAGRGRDRAARHPRPQRR